MMKRIVKTREKPQFAIQKILLFLSKKRLCSSPDLGQPHVKVKGNTSEIFP